MRGRRGWKMESVHVEAAGFSSDLLLLDEPPFGVSSCDLRHCEPAASLRADGGDEVERLWPLPLGPVRNVCAPPFSKQKTQNPTPFCMAQSPLAGKHDTGNPSAPYHKENKSGKHCGKRGLQSTSSTLMRSKKTQLALKRPVWLER